MSTDETTAAPEQGAAAPALTLDEASHVYLVGRILESLAAALYTYGGAQLSTPKPTGGLLLPVEDRASAFINGRRVGRVQMFAPKKTATLKNDDPRLIQWALKNDRYKEHVLNIQIVSPALVNIFKAHALKVGAAVDKHGEEIPGLTLNEGDPTPTKSLDKAFMEELLDPERIQAIVADIIAGAVSLPGLGVAPSIEGGSQS